MTRTHISGSLGLDGQVLIGQHTPIFRYVLVFILFAVQVRLIVLKTQMFRCTFQYMLNSRVNTDTIQTEASRIRLRLELFSRIQARY